MKPRFRRLATTALAAATLLAVAVPAAGTATAAPACTTNCLRVFSIKTYTYLGPTVEAHVKVVDENGGNVRGAVVNGVWTQPDGSQLSRYDRLGTRLRAEFPLYSDQSGTFTFDVANITLAGYTFDPNGGAPTTVSIDIGEPATGCTADCASISSIKMSERKGDVRALVVAEDETGDAIRNGVVTATWTLPDGSTVGQSLTTNRKGKARLSVPATDVGTYSVTIDDVTAAGLTFDPDTSVLAGSIVVD